MLNVYAKIGELLNLWTETFYFHINGSEVMSLSLCGLITGWVERSALVVWG